MINLKWDVPEIQITNFENRPVYTFAIQLSPAKLNESPERPKNAESMKMLHDNNKKQENTILLFYTIFLKHKKTLFKILFNFFQHRLLIFANITIRKS